ncbi:MAG: mitochondrial fission ELM1 family protein [Pseudomonadota bacterium]
MNLLRTTQDGDLGVRSAPERVVLGVRSGETPSPKPPVRIFLGTEPAQYKAERIFVWSIEQVRDPARVYEVHIMKELAGFRRLGWLTGFTNYRFAIPHFAGAEGRAIYNDVDQVYLRDPAELFDAEMNDHGILAISPGGRLDTSVMLLDCARMAGLWPLEEAKTRRKNGLIKRAKVAGVVGELAGLWNARDQEYRTGESGVLHYTTLQKQPWRPFPKRFVYQRNPVADVWLDLERQADAAGYQLYDWRRPSPYYSDLVEQARRAGNRPKNANGFAVPDELIAKTGAKSLLRYALGGGAANGATLYDPAVSAPPAEPSDGVLCGDGLETLPEAEAAWLVDQLFAQARRLLYVEIDEDKGAQPPRGQFWWFSLFQDCSARHSEVHWRLKLKCGGRELGRDGGPRLDGPPNIWVLDDGKAGHTTQSVGLADALGWPYEIKTLDVTFSKLAGVGCLFTGPLGATRAGTNVAKSDPLEAPWPDLVISTGWRPSPTTRWIGDQSRGHSRLVQMDRKGGRVVELFDALVACSYFGLPYHPRRVEITTPLNRASKQRLAEAAAQWQGLFEGMPGPHIAVLVGGPSRRHSFSPELAGRMGRELAAFAEAAGGSLFAVTSRRTGAAATEAFASGLRPVDKLYRWQDGAGDNPFMGCLALADLLVVTGESESMLSEAASTGKPIYIYPVPDKPPGLWGHVEDWVTAQAFQPRRNRRGTGRPQRGLARLCAKLVGRGLVQPRRDINLLHQILYDKDLARPFGQPLEIWSPEPLHEADVVAEELRRLLGLSRA